MRGTVLIVEDSEACAETLQVALETMPGIDIRILHSYAAVMGELENAGSNVAAVVTDLHLTDRDDAAGGLDLIRRMRADPRFAKLPAILISGDSDPRLPADAAATGASAFFSKPYSPAAVRRKLEQLLC